MLFNQVVQDSSVYLPVLAWAGLGLFLLIAQIFSIPSRVLYVLSCFMGAAIVALTHVWTPSTDLLFSGAAVFDSLAKNVLTICSIGALGAILLVAGRMLDSSKMIRTAYEQLPEFLICLCFSMFGLGVLITCQNMSSLFLGVETLSIGLYALCAFYRTEIRSTESGFKYLMMGAFSTVLLLFGLAFLYGATGAGGFSEINQVLAAGIGEPHLSLLTISIVFLVAAFAFKLTLLPFHFYAPDVYEGAPSPLTFLLSTVVKAGVMVAAVRLFSICLSNVSFLWQPLFVLLSLISILIGNIMALQQRSLKRLLAFSGISHSGFMVLTIVTPSIEAVPALVSYLAAYTFMNLGLFAVIVTIENENEAITLSSLKGLAQQKLGTSLMLAVFLLGLAGLPPFAGFLIKFWVLNALIQHGLYVVALCAALGGVIGAAYYLRVLMNVFMSDADGQPSLTFKLSSYSRLVYLALVFGAFVTLCGGLRPQIYADWILGALALK